MHFTSILSVTLAAFITTTQAIGALGGAAAAASKGVQFAGDVGQAAAAAANGSGPLITTLPDGRRVFSVGKRATPAPGVELSWVDGGHGFQLSNVPQEVIDSIKIWNSMPVAMKLGAEAYYGKVEIIGSNMIHASGYPDTKYELRQMMKAWNYVVKEKKEQ